MCLSKGKIKVELELTPHELLELAKFLKKKVSTVTTLQAKDEGGESGKGNN